MSTPIDQLKRQLRQLAEQAEAGTLTDDAHQAAKAKLERQIVNAVLAEGAPSQAAASTVASTVAPSGTSEPPARISPKLKWGMLAFVVAVTAGGYAIVGTPAGLRASSVGTNNADTASPETADGASAPAHTMSSDQIAALSESLVNKLKTDPNNAKGWAMLARSYAVLGRYPEAVAAYQRVIALSTDDPQVYADYADVLAVTQGRKLEGEPAKLVDKALSLDGNNFKALSLSGSLAYDKQDFKRAAELWGRALQHAPTNNPELIRQIRAAVDDTRQKAGLPPLAPKPSQNPG